jgi:SAM-dependent methyltransferase
MNNPFGFDRLNWAYGWEFIRDKDVILDYGCFDGKFINTLAKSKDVQVFGADKNLDVVKSVNQNNVVHIQKELPFSDEYFDIVTMFEVLEHVHDQRYLLRELHRVLKDGSLVIISVPKYHCFSFLDVGNLKYIFPKIHKYWYTKNRSPTEYHYRYVDNPSGLIGDVEKEKAWHQHFEVSELSNLLKSSGFAIKNLDGYGGFGILLAVMSSFLKIRVPERLKHWQMIKFDQERLLCVAQKISIQGHKAPTKVY